MAVWAVDSRGVIVPFETGPEHPANHVVHDDGVTERGEWEWQARRSELRWTRIEALAALVVAIFAIPAAIFAYNASRTADATLKEQQTINASQAEVNRIEQERFARRYAGRVSWWLDLEDQDVPEGSEVYDLYIQNRSLVPISQATIVGAISSEPSQANLDVIAIGDIPPCTLISVKFSKMSADRLYFRDPVGVWLNSNTEGVRSVNGDEVEKYPLASHDLKRTDLLLPAEDISAGLGLNFGDERKVREATDCGEG